MSSENQPSKMLSDLANLLAETYQLFGEVTSDFIVHSVFKFMAALVLEVRSKSEPVSKFLPGI